MAKLKIIEVKSEVGAGTRGARLGVDALKTVGFESGDNFFNQFKSEEVDTFNSALYDAVSDSPAKYSGAVVKTCQSVAAKIQKTLKDGFFPFVIAGDHSSAAGTISGIKSAYPESRLGVIWVDAHADLQTPYTSESGNMHGMPLAAVSGIDNLEMSINELSESEKLSWENLKTLSKIQPAINIEDIVFIGARDIDKAEAAIIEKYGMTNHTVSDVRNSGPELISQKVFEELAHCDMIYLSFDVDSMDPEISRGTGTPVPDGFQAQEVAELLKLLASHEKIATIEIVEINPTLDKENKMAKTVFPIIKSLSEEILQNNT